MSPTLADGLAVPSVGPHAFEVARHFVDSVHLTSEAQVAISVLRLIEHEKVKNPRVWGLVFGVWESVVLAVVRHAVAVLCVDVAASS